MLGNIGDKTNINTVYKISRRMSKLYIQRNITPFLAFQHDCKSIIVSLNHAIILVAREAGSRCTNCATDKSAWREYRAMRRQQSAMDDTS